LASGYVEVVCGGAGLGRLRENGRFRIVGQWLPVGEPVGVKCNLKHCNLKHCNLKHCNLKHGQRNQMRQT